MAQMITMGPVRRPRPWAEEDKFATSLTESSVTRSRQLGYNPMEPSSTGPMGHGESTAGATDDALSGAHRWTVESDTFHAIARTSWGTRLPGDRSHGDCTCLGAARFGDVAVVRRLDLLGHCGT